MSSQGKRMVNENLIAILKEMDSKGISIADLADVLDAFASGEVQEKLTAGDNISISEENVISATDTTYTAGSGITITDGVISSTGGTLYSHDILLRYSYAPFNATANIINKTSTALTRATLATYLYSNNLTSSTAMLNANGDIKINDVLYDIIGIYATSNSQTAIKVVYLDADDTIQSYSWNDTYGVVNDTVVEI